MKKIMGKCGMFVLALVLAVGIFWIFQKQQAGKYGENGTLVKKTAWEGGKQNEYGVSADR